MASVIPFGQPMMPSHHSYGRDKRYRERIHNKFGKAFELDDQAKYWERRADVAESENAISSDDPEAIVKLKEQFAGMEERQERMKAVNAAWRKAKKPEPDDTDGWTKVAEHLGVMLEELGSVRRHFAGHQKWSGRQPFEKYELQNNNGNMRRVRERIDELRRSANAVDVEVDHGVCQYVENADENRVQLIFPGKPPKETRQMLGRYGFRWSPANTAWQRLLNDAGRHAAQSVIKELTKEKETT